MTPIYHRDCRHFDGFRPCRFRRACDGCPHHDPPSSRTLIVNLDAMGDVARTTALLAPLHRARPGTHVSWITEPHAAPLLDHVDGLDRVLPLGPWMPALLDTLRFDLVLGVDKSLRGGALTMAAQADERRGFGLDRRGAIVPLTPDADRLYQLGLDDDAKFRGNTRAETQLLAEALGFEHRRDPYAIALSAAEARGARAWRREQGIADREPLVGINTGSSPQFPYKHLVADDQIRLLDALAERLPGVALALLGGPQDRVRNERIATGCRRARPLRTPTDEGLRRGMQMVAACDVVISGDSLGMHLAIGLGKPVIAWFGLSPHAEIDLYDRGSYVLADVSCRPCMRARCDEEPKCFRRVPLDTIVDETVRWVATVRSELG